MSDVQPLFQGLCNLEFSKITFLQKLDLSLCDRYMYSHEFWPLLTYEGCANIYDVTYNAQFSVILYTEDGAGTGAGQEEEGAL